MESLQKYNNYLGILNCLRCKFCTVTDDYSETLCPPYEEYKFFAYSAGGMVQIARAILTNTIHLSPDVAEVIYKCTTCGACITRCPNRYLNRPEFNPVTVIETLREELVNSGIGPMPFQRKFGNSIKENHNPYGEKHETRTLWKPKNSSKGDTIYFVGCTTAYRHPEIAKSAFNILEAADIDFQVMPDEWCCGSPLLRTGQRKIAEESIHHNVNVLNSMGVKQVITSCPGCYSTLKSDYPKIVGNTKFKVLHISEILQKILNEGRLEFKKIRKKVTYHDPCHLGRFEGVYDPPREVLRVVPGIELVEMRRTREYSWCCGAGGGVMSAFPEFAAKTADVRIQEALETGAESFVSTCPFCKHNFVRAAEQFNRDIEILDLTEIVAKAISDD